MEVSEKSKKNEILDAYYDLLKKVQTTKDVSHQEVQLKQQNEEVVVRAAQFDVEHIVTTLGQVKVMVAQNLGLLEKKLTEEYGRLSELQHAISLESKNLEELHQIKKNADSFAVLLLAQKERKAVFEADIEEQKRMFEQELVTKRLEWNLEKERHDKATAEHLALVKKERTRDEEEYRYKTALERKKDQDAYEVRKNSLERELQERKELFEKECSARQLSLGHAEEELAQLRLRVHAFPKELEQSVASAEEKIRELLNREYRYTADLKTAEIEGDKKLQQQTIGSLQARIKEQETLIRDLSHKNEVAGQQVQSIALKALDSSVGALRVEQREENKAVQR